MPGGLRALLLFAGVVTVSTSGRLLIERDVSGPPVAVLMALGMSGLSRLLNHPGAARRERRAKGLCAACGYSLTGNLSGACPDCGRRRP